jgi:hypothetical protein
MAQGMPWRFELHLAAARALTAAERNLRLAFRNLKSAEHFTCNGNRRLLLFRNSVPEQGRIKWLFGDMRGSRQKIRSWGYKSIGQIAALFGCGRTVVHRAIHGA